MDDGDLSQLIPPISISLTGVEKILSAYRTGTNEIRQLLGHECNVILECKKCSSLYRSVANFISHKRAYCNKPPKNPVEALRKSHHLDSFTTMRVNSQSTNVASIDAELNRRDLNHIVNRLALNVEHSSDKIWGLSNAEDNVKYYTSLAEAVKERRSTRGEQTISLFPLKGTDHAVLQSITQHQTMNTEESLAGVRLEGNQDMRGVEEGAMRRRRGRPKKRWLDQQPEASETKTDISKTMTIAPSNPQQPEKGVANSTLSDQFCCKKCNAKFASRKTLILHENTQHKPTRIQYKCPSCSKLFCNLWSTYRHLKNIHHKTQDQIEKMKTLIRKKAFSTRVPFHAKPLSNSKQFLPAPGSALEVKPIDSIKTWKADDINFMVDVGDNRCGCCGLRFERRAALVSHTMTCHRRPNSNNTVPAYRRQDKSPRSSSPSEASIVSRSSSADNRGTSDVLVPINVVQSSRKNPKPMRIPRPNSELVTLHHVETLKTLRVKVLPEVSTDRKLRSPMVKLTNIATSTPVTNNRLNNEVALTLKSSPPVIKTRNSTVKQTSPTTSVLTSVKRLATHGVDKRGRNSKLSAGSSNKKLKSMGVVKQTEMNTRSSRSSSLPLSDTPNLKDNKIVPIKMPKISPGASKTTKPMPALKTVNFVPKKKPDAKVVKLLSSPTRPNILSKNSSPKSFDASKISSPEKGLSPKKVLSPERVIRSSEKINSSLEGAISIPEKASYTKRVLSLGNVTSNLDKTTPLSLHLLPPTKTYPSSLEKLSLKSTVPPALPLTPLPVSIPLSTPTSVSLKPVHEEKPSQQPQKVEIIVRTVSDKSLLPTQTSKTPATSIKSESCDPEKSSQCNGSEENTSAESPGTILVRNSADKTALTSSSSSHSEEGGTMLKQAASVSLPRHWFAAGSADKKWEIAEASKRSGIQIRRDYAKVARSDSTDVDSNASPRPDSDVGSIEEEGDFQGWDGSVPILSRSSADGTTVEKDEDHIPSSHPGLYMLSDMKEANNLVFEVIVGATPDLGDDSPSSCSSDSESSSLLMDVSSDLRMKSFEDSSNTSSVDSRKIKSSLEVEEEAAKRRRLAESPLILAQKPQQK